MEWILIILLGAMIGALANFITERAEMPSPLTITLAIAGAIVGAGLAHLTAFDALAELTPYFMATVVAFGFLAGGMLAFSIIHKRASRY